MIVHELTDWNEHYWITTHAWATSWEHTETVTLRDVPDGTLVSLAGWWSRPAPTGLSFEYMREHFQQLATEYFDDLAARAAPPPSDRPG